jgi:hypothetical protein
LLRNVDLPGESRPNGLVLDEATCLPLGSMPDGRVDRPGGGIDVDGRERESPLHRSLGQPDALCLCVGDDCERPVEHAFPNHDHLIVGPKGEATPAHRPQPRSAPRCGI